MRDYYGANVVESRSHVEGAREWLRLFHATVTVIRVSRIATVTRTIHFYF
jgi:hypothetical protein